MPDATTCAICGLWYHQPGEDQLDICPPCLRLNFSALHDFQPPPAPSLGEPTHVVDMGAQAPLTTRQKAAMARLHPHWEAEAIRRQAGEEDEA